MMDIPALLGILSIFGFIFWVVSTFRSDGKREEKLKNAEAINDQNDELLDFVKKQKDFESRVRRDPSYAERLRNQINDNLEK